MLTAIVAGCASQETIRVVDATSGEPLGNVRVERLEESYQPSAMPFVVMDELSAAEKQTTDQAGAVTFQKSGSKFMVNPSGANSAYNDAYVKVTWSGAKVHYLGEYREFPVSKKDGVVEIPLRRRLIIPKEPQLAANASASHTDTNRGKPDPADATQHDDRPATADTLR
jgi:hypothetical protein